MQCKKIKYDSQIDAMRALISCYKAKYRKSKIYRMEDAVYFCQRCQAWHLSSNKRKDRRLKNN